MKRLFLISLVSLVILLPQVSWAAPAFLSAIAGGSTNQNGFTTGTFDSTGATLIVCSLSWFAQQTEPVITDSKSNTWVTSLTAKSYSTTGSTHLIYTIPTSVGSGHTITVTQAASFPSVACAAFSGTKPTSPADVQNGAATTIALTLSTGSIAAAAGAVGVTGLVENGSGLAATIDNSFTVAASKLAVGGQCFGAHIAYKLSAGTVNPAWTWDTAVGGATAIASFLQAITFHPESSLLGVYR